MAQKPAACRPPVLHALRDARPKQAPRGQCRKNPSPPRAHPRNRTPFMQQTRGSSRPARSIVAPFATPRHGDPHAARRPARCAAQRGQCRENPSPPRAHLCDRTLFMRQARRSPPGAINCRPLRHPAPRRPSCSKAARPLRRAAWAMPEKSFATPRHRNPYAAGRPARYGRCRKAFATPRASSRQSAVHAPNPRRPPPGAINVAPFATPRHGGPYAARRPARCAAQPPGAAVLGNLTGPLSAANRTGPSPGFSQKNRAVAFRLRSCLFSYTAPTYSSSVMS